MDDGKIDRSNETDSDKYQGTLGSLFALVSSWGLLTDRGILLC